MRNLALVCVSLAVVAGISAANLWRELRAERTLTASLRAELAEAALRPPAQAPVQFVPPPVRDVAAPTSPPQAVVTAAVQPAAPAPPAQDRASDEAVLAASLSTSMARQRELLKDPEYRAAQQAQMRMTIPQNFPGLLDALQLSPEEGNKVFDLLAAHQMEQSELALPMLAANPDQAAIEQRSRMQNELRQRQQSEMASLLGSRYSQWETYQQDRNAHVQVAQLGRNLDSTGQALSAAQTRSLVAALAPEQRRTTQQLQSMSASLAMTASSDPQSRAQGQARMMEEQLRMRAESNQRMLDAARSHLNAAQLETYRNMMDSQITMLRLSMRAAQEQTALQGATGVSGVSLSTTGAVTVVP